MGPDFNLPENILSVIPTDPYDLLDLARKITSMAIVSRVTMLESEADHLQQKLHDKDRVIGVLEGKVSQLKAVYQESELRLKIAREENMNLLRERDSLAFTVEKLGNNLVKLQNFKKQLMQSLNDENSPQSSAVDIGIYEQSLPKTCLINDEDYFVSSKYHSMRGYSDSASIDGDVVEMISRLTPSGTPKIISNSVSPIRYLAASSPLRTSGTSSPTQYSFSSQYSSSQQSSGTTSPTHGRPPPARNLRSDGKEFFRQARSRLSLEQFSAFLANVKELNAQRQSREETLRKAVDIFGKDNKDLYVLFQGLLSRSSHEKK